MEFNAIEAEKNFLQMIPCEKLKGVGPNVRAKLENLGIFSVYDVLLHLPLKYENRTCITPLNQLHAGNMVLVQGKIVFIDKLPTKKPQLVCNINDGSGQIMLRFFHFAHMHGLILNNEIRCYGEVRFGSYGLEMVHPEFEIIHPEVDVPLQTGLSPVYPTTSGLSQRFWRKITDQALVLLNRCNVEALPQKVVQEEKLWSFHDALNYLHRPPIDADANFLLSEKHPARKRLIFEELLAHQLSLRYVRESAQSHHARDFNAYSSLLEPFKQQLPFAMTEAQSRVCQEILQDLMQNKPMLRLVQGDVGSGKTVVAAYVALQVIGHQAQVAIMAPTEILAEQHYFNFQKWFSTLNIQVELLHGKTKISQRKEILEKLAKGEVHLIIGTHALFQDTVMFKELALVVVDEQHRFGVHQRMALRDKGVQGKYYPHQLIMTATPIPRTLAMCAYADLDYSVIDELPPGRKPVKTIAVDNHRRDEIIQRIADLCKEGQQVYWVCTLIEESEILQAEAATNTFELLKEKLPNLKLNLIHGRLTAKEKEAIMQEFKQGQIDLLIATTVIEVGVDVPNASLMIIENAERLGLAQLHQLRGRVGRGQQESHCVLLYQSPLSKTAKHRLQTMRESHDGFYIAEQDLKLRGPGEFLGVRQTGDMRMRIADLVRDADYLPKIQQVAIELMQYHPHAAQQVYQRWLNEAQKYSQV